MTAATEIQRYQPSQPVSQAATIEQSRATAEVLAQVTVAKNCPRNLDDAVYEMRQACSRKAMAEKAFYAVPNRGTGPSVHLLRELARAWGNIQHGSKELNRDDAGGISEVEAYAWDMQQNTRTNRMFITPHQRMKGGNRQQLHDLTDIQNNNNSAAGRAVRECISYILPRWFVDEAAELCRQTLENGEGVPLQERIDSMLDWFGGKFGVTVEQIEARLDKRRGKWTASDLAEMKIAGQSIQAGEATKAELFPPLASSIADEIAGPAQRTAAVARAALDKLAGVGVEIIPNDPGEPVDSESVGPATPDNPKPARKSRAARNSERNAERAEVQAEADKTGAEVFEVVGPVITSVEGTTGEDLPAAPADEHGGAAEAEPTFNGYDAAHVVDEIQGVMPADTAGPITGRQMGKLFSLRANTGKYPSGTIAGNTAWEAFMSESAGRPIDHARKLTDAEAALIIDVLESGQ